MSKEKCIKVVRNGKEVIYETLPRSVFFEANKRIELKMAGTVNEYKAKAVASKISVSKLIVNG